MENIEKAFEGQLKALGDQLESTLEEWRASDSQQRNEIEKSIRALEDEIGSVKASIAENREFSLPGVEVAKDASDREGFSVARACRAIAMKNFDHAPYEQEVFANMRQKAQTLDPGTAGGYVVPEEAIRPIIEKLKAEVTVFERGATEMQCTGVPCIIPQITTASTATWIATEGTQISDSSMVFDQISLTPKTVAGRVILSNLLLETSQPAADSIIEQDLAQQIGLAVDAAVLKGSGASGQPEGIMTNAAVASVTTSLTTSVTPTYAELLEFIETLEVANALKGRLGWILHPLAASQIRQMTTTGSLELARVDVGMGVKPTILGYPYSISTQMEAPTGSAGTKSFMFGNFSDVMVARWGGMRLLASNTSDDAFSRDQTHVRATMRLDVGLRHTESFAYDA